MLCHVLDTHKALMFLGRKLWTKVSKPFNETEVTDLVHRTIVDFPNISVCVTAQELVELHQKQKAKFDEYEIYIFTFFKILDALIEVTTEQL